MPLNQLYSTLNDQIASILQVIFQQSLNSGQIPSDWKKANVTPLFKKLHWIKAFLLGRTQCVALEGESSSHISVTSGVPQGSVLGPILIHSQVRLFADNTAIYLTVDSKNDCKTLQQELQKLEAWEKNWEMDFNPSKCQVLHISRSRNPIKHSYILHGKVLQEVDHAKYLGLDISRDLSWNNHIQNVTVKANRILGFIRRNIRIKHKGTRDTAYNTLVRPQVEYASPV